MCPVHPCSISGGFRWEILEQEIVEETMWESHVLGPLNRQPSVRHVWAVSLLNPWSWEGPPLRCGFPEQDVAATVSMAVQVT